MAKAYTGDLTVVAYNTNKCIYDNKWTRPLGALSSMKRRYIVGKERSDSFLVDINCYDTFTACLLIYAFKNILLDFVPGDNRRLCTHANYELIQSVVKRVPVNIFHHISKAYRHAQLSGRVTPCAMIVSANTQRTNRCIYTDFVQVNRRGPTEYEHVTPVCECENWHTKKYPPAVTNWDSPEANFNHSWHTSTIYSSVRMSKPAGGIFECKRTTEYKYIDWCIILLPWIDTNCTNALLARGKTYVQTVYQASFESALPGANIDIQIDKKDDATFDITTSINDKDISIPYYNTQKITVHNKLVSCCYTTNWTIDSISHILLKILNYEQKKPTSLTIPHSHFVIYNYSSKFLHVYKEYTGADDSQVVPVELVFTAADIDPVYLDCYDDTKGYFILDNGSYFDVINVGSNESTICKLVPPNDINIGLHNSWNWAMNRVNISSNTGMLDRHSFSNQQQMFCEANPIIILGMLACQYKQLDTFIMSYNSDSVVNISPIRIPVTLDNNIMPVRVRILASDNLNISSKSFLFC